MFKKKKVQGQITAEYAFLLVLIVAVVGSMTVYVKRSLQGRLRDARWAMLNTVRKYEYLPPEVALGNIVIIPVPIKYQGTLWLEYEPYYANRISEMTVIEDNQKTLLQGGSTGIYRETLDETRKATTVSQQFPPKDAD